MNRDTDYLGEYWGAVRDGLRIEQARELLQSVRSMRGNDLTNIILAINDLAAKHSQETQCRLKAYELHVTTRGD